MISPTCFMDESHFTFIHKQLICLTLPAPPDLKCGNSPWWKNFIGFIIRFCWWILKHKYFRTKNKWKMPNTPFSSIVLLNLFVNVLIAALMPPEQQIMLHNLSMMRLRNKPMRKWPKSALMASLGFAYLPLNRSARGMKSCTIMETMKRICGGAKR